MNKSELEQTELDFGPIENHPTPFKEVRDPRPNWHTPEVAEYVYAALEELICEKNEDIKEYVEEDFETLASFNHYDDDFKVSKFLIDDFGIDYEDVYNLRSDIERFCVKAEGFLSKKVAEWVNFWNIIPPANVGDKIMVSHLSKKYGKPKEHLVVDVRSKTAQIIAYELVGHYTEEEALKRKCGTILTYEQVAEWLE